MKSYILISNHYQRLIPGSSSRIQAHIDDLGAHWQNFQSDCMSSCSIGCMRTSTGDDNFQNISEISGYVENVEGVVAQVSNVFLSQNIHKSVFSVKDVYRIGGYF